MNAALIDKTSLMVTWITTIEEAKHHADNFIVVETDDAQVGNTYDPEREVFIKPPPAGPEVYTSVDVNAERDTRLHAGFMFGGKVFDCRPDDQTNISGAAQMAFMAVVAGAPKDNLRWNKGVVDFAWITQDNSTMPMDAHTVIAFGQAAASWKQAHMFAGRALKDMPKIPQDFNDDKWWPSV